MSAYQWAVAKVLALSIVGLASLAIGAFDWQGPGAIVSRADDCVVGMIFLGLALSRWPEPAR